MKSTALALKSRLFGGGGTASGVLAGIGSIHTTQILPLMFLQTYQLYFWIAALVFTAASLYFFVKQRHPMTRDRNLLLINTGLLIFGLPLPQIADFMDTFRFIGGSLAVFGVCLLFFGKKFQFVYRPLINTPRRWPASQRGEPNGLLRGGHQGVTLQSALFIIVIGGFLMNQFLMWKMDLLGSLNNLLPISISITKKTVPELKLTSFDVALAKERMDKNNDGICDTCGMKIEQCINTGQIDCNMENDPNAIGILGSQHIHADFKVYVNGQALDFAKPENFMKSSFVHLDQNPNLEHANSVLHMHAKNVPLWLFFRSLSMKLEKDSLSLVDGRTLKNENGNTLKLYLNGKKVDSLENYVFQNLDKILISYGPENDPDIQKQNNSVTNFAKDH